MAPTENLRGEFSPGSEAGILRRLLHTCAVDEVHQGIALRRRTAETFVGGSADLSSVTGNIHVTINDRKGARWQQVGAVAVILVPELPGFQIAREGHDLIIEVGLLPGDRLCYRDREKDQYLSMEEVTRRILDRALFPKLRET